MQSLWQACYHSPTWNCKLVKDKQAHDQWVSLRNLQRPYSPNNSSLLSAYKEIRGRFLLDGMVHVFQYVLFKVFASIHTFQILPELLKKVTWMLIPNNSSFNCLVLCLFFMGPEGDCPVFFNTQSQRLNAALSGCSVQQPWSLLTRKEQGYNVTQS